MHYAYNGLGNFQQEKISFHFNQFPPKEFTFLFFLLREQGKADINCQNTGSHGGEQAAEECMPKANDDGKPCTRNRRRNARSQCNLLEFLDDSLEFSRLPIIFICLLSPLNLLYGICELLAAMGPSTTSQRGGDKEKIESKRSANKSSIYLMCFNCIDALDKPSIFLVSVAMDHNIEPVTCYFQHRKPILKHCMIF